MDEQFDRSLAISDETTNWLQHGPWTPIMAALLVSGIRPPRWANVPPAENHSNDRPVSHRDLFVERLRTSRTLAFGLDGQKIRHNSVRFKSAENILVFLDQFCRERDCYLISISPKVFVTWLRLENAAGHVHIPKSMWLDAFANNYGHSDLILPKEVLERLSANSKAVRKPSPKHKFAYEIGRARSEAERASDHDEILALLAERMRKGEIPGITLLEHSRESGIRYLEEGKARTLLRDSFARQLRRLSAKERSTIDSASSSSPSDEFFPEIKLVAIRPGDISIFTSKEELAKLAHDLLLETIAYVRWAAAMQVSDTGWPRDVAILVGNVVRLGKLLVAIDTLAFSKMEDVLNLTILLAVETIVDLKYLLENGDAKLLDSYVGIPSKKGSKARKGWADLDLKQKAEATGFGSIYADILQDAPFYLHGSWKDLTENHLSTLANERYRVKSVSTEVKPRLLIAVSILTVDVIYTFSHVLGDAPAVGKLQSALKEVYSRLKIASEELSKLDA